MADDSIQLKNLIMYQTERTASGRNYLRGGRARTCGLLHASLLMTQPARSLVMGGGEGRRPATCEANTSVRLIDVLVVPHAYISYGLCVHGGTSHLNLNKRLILQNRALRKKERPGTVISRQ